MTSPPPWSGDWNIAPLDEDVFDIAQFRTSTHVTEPERAAFQAFLEDGYADVVRPHTPGPEVYTYWDYYRQRFERNRGLRIDFVLGLTVARGPGQRGFHRPRRAGRHRRLRPCSGRGGHRVGLFSACPPGLSVVPVMLDDMETTTFLALISCLVIGAAFGALIGVLWARSSRSEDPRLAQALDQRSADQAVVREGLERLQDQMRDLEHTRVSWQGQLHQQVQDMRFSTEALRRETQSLSTALRKPQVRGRWGELHLRRAVELAGLVDRCDFSEQVRLEDGALRPDLVVNLVGGRRVVVDAKVPLDACLDASSSDDDDERAHHLARHARQLRTHVDLLGSKQYWRSLPETPEFVVLFLPAESFLAAALETDPALIEYAADRQVVLATPTTLIALLRTVAHGWSHEALAEQAQEIHRLGRELHGRLASMSGHLDQVGRSLNAAVGHYNQAIGSLESRVLVSARRFQDLSVTDDELPSPRQVEATTRSVSPPDRIELHAVTRRGASTEDDGGHSLAL